jgi:uncharacterized membrane protein
MESGAKAEGHVPRSRARFRREESELEFGRIVAFSDGVFAIAITLLVLSLQIPSHVPDLSQTLRDKGPSLFAFGLSFAVLARIWLFHHRLFATLTRFDGNVIVLNFLYLALVTLVPFSCQVIGDYGHESIAAILYATNIGVLGLTGAVMVRYAFRRDLVNPEVAERLEMAPGADNWMVGAVFLVTIPIAAFSAAAAEWSWVALFLFAGFGGRRVHSRFAGGGRTTG